MADSLMHTTCLLCGKHAVSVPWGLEGLPYENYSYCPECIHKAMKLLKEQEPVAPVMVPHSRGIAYNCGACGTEIAVIRDTVSADWQKNSVRFCQRCGRAVKWE